MSDSTRQPCLACGKPTLAATLRATDGYCRHCRPGRRSRETSGTAQTDERSGLAPPPLSLPALQLSGAFTVLYAPIQAEGVVAGKSFYFRARHRDWTFSVANGTEPDPVAISGSSQGFFRAGVLPVAVAANPELSLAASIEIIRQCAGAYLASGAA